MLDTFILTTSGGLPLLHAVQLPANVPAENSQELARRAAYAWGSQAPSFVVLLVNPATNSILAINSSEIK